MTSLQKNFQKSLSWFYDTMKDVPLKNFTVEGWPETKSRSAEDYINYGNFSSTATLFPEMPFTSMESGTVLVIYTKKI